MQSKISAGILGATGVEGQRFLQTTGEPPVVRSGVALLNAELLEAQGYIGG